MNALSPALEKEWDAIEKQFIESGYDTEDVRMARFATTNFAYQHFMLNDSILGCNNCSLGNQCQGPVTGAGSNRSPIMIIGEAPGETEDRFGLPLIGSSGQLLSLVMTKLGVDRTQCYVTNAVKCRPPENRTPNTEESASCFKHLHKEIQIVNPDIIITLGNVAMRMLRQDQKLKITQERGQWHKFKNWKKDVYIIHTFHPSFILRQKGEALIKAKMEFWEDLSIAFSKAKEMRPNFSLKGSMEGVI